MGMGLGLGLGLGRALPPQLGFNSTGLPIFSAGIRAVQANTGDCEVLWVGDSTTAGVGNGNVSGALDGNAKLFNPATVLAGLFSALLPSTPSAAGLIYGNARRTTTAAYNSYDARVTFSGAFALVQNTQTVGGGYFSCAAAGAMLVDLDGACDQMTFGMQNAVAGVFQVIVASTVVATVTTTNGSMQTVSIPAGTTSVGINWVSGTIRIHKIHGSSTTVKRVYVASIGQPGQTLSSYLTSGSVQNTRDVIAASSPKLVIIDSWINEANASQDVTTYKAALQGFVDTAKGAGSDVLIYAGHHTGITSESIRPNYVQWMQDIAALNSIPYFDLAGSSANFASYTAANAAGYMDTDFTHLFKPGAAAKAASTYARLTS